MREIFKKTIRFKNYRIKTYGKDKKKKRQKNEKKKITMYVAWKDCTIAIFFKDL
jgi:hypothetical protein